MVGIMCPDPGRPMQGSQQTSDYRDMQLVIFQCDLLGYDMWGTSTTQCNVAPDGSTSWSSDVPVCEGKKISKGCWCFVLLNILKKKLNTIKLWFKKTHMFFLMIQNRKEKT